MLLRRLILALLLIGAVSGLSAQDIHYTLHNYSPLWLNPANAGAFSGSIRVAGHYRGQYLGANPANTPGLSIDAPVIRGFRKQDWIGVGANLISDQANQATVDVIRQVFGFSGAYHFSLDKKQQNVLTLGVTYGSTSIGIDPTGNCGVQQLNISEGLGGAGLGPNRCEMLGMGGGVGGGGGNQNPNNDDGPRDSYTDISAGLMYRTVLDAKSNDLLEFGFAVQHINQDDYRAFARDTTGNGEMGGSSNRETRTPGRTLHAHANLDMEVADNIRFMPTVFWQSNRGNSSISLQAWAGLELKNDILFKFGLGYRTSDAGKILIGVTKDRLNVAASYDVVLDQQPTDDLGSLNTIEIAANYIFNITKKPEVKPSILCPRL